MKIYDDVKVKAPAIITNIGCGCNMMAVAPSTMADEIVIRQSDQPGVKIVKIAGGYNELPSRLQKKRLQALRPRSCSIMSWPTIRQIKIWRLNLS